MIKYLSLFLVISLFAKPERHYQEIWCKQNNGIIEYTLKDRTRIDCLTNIYAVEVDFAKKWAESIGQSLYYSIQTNKLPAVLLIVTSDKDYRYILRLNKVAKKYNIKVFITGR